MVQSRQLAAIMFVDIAGYTTMMQENEETTLLHVERLQKKLEQEIAGQGGKIIKFSGDGALCSFESSITACRVAVDVQLAMQTEPKIPVRIGIHQADVVFTGADIYGDGVNIASRLESLAIPGSILISAKVYDDIKNHSDFKAISLGKYALKNVNQPIEIFSLSNQGLRVPVNKKLEGKGIKYISDKISFRKKTLLIRAIASLFILGVLAFLLIPPIIKKQHARNELLPRIKLLVDNNFRAPTEAFDLALEAEKFIPEDTALISLWPLLSVSISIHTEPEGAEVFWKDYNSPDAPWRLAGTTPLTAIRFPKSYLRMEIRKDGYQTIEYAGPWAYGNLGPDIDTLKLDKLGTLPENMIRIPANQASMYIVGLEQEAGKPVGEFLIDKYEVTNKQFKEFVDAGGYTNLAFWQHPVYLAEELIPFEEAQKLYIDKTGRPGPATWEAGTYPDGQEDHPVTGVSWYEAAAHAVFVKKQLPSIFHWSVVTATSRTEFIVPLSNYNGESTTPVGSFPGYSTFGVYDLGGNAREWCLNGSNLKGYRYILGGGYNDPTYSFNDSYTQAAMDRSLANGFRCMLALPEDTTLVSQQGIVSPLFRDYQEEKPVDDKTFSLFVKQFTYDKSPLNSKIEKTLDRENWTGELVTFDLGYNDDRMMAWVYTPKGEQETHQPIVFFPGSGDIYSKEFDPDRITGRIDFILKSGRALIWPIYKGTHERHDDLSSDLPDETAFYKDHVVMWVKEFGRTIDYLETRQDIEADKLGYLGWSWGGFMGGIIPAVEQRIKAIVLNVGGMAMNRALPEVDQLNYLPRVTQPILMLNGKHDMFFPVETSQMPMFHLLGTDEANKKIIIYESGHLVPRTEFVKETLLWFDRYLGQ